MTKNENEFLCVNRLLIKKYGSKIAAFLSELINLDNEKDYFACSTNQITDSIGFTKKQQVNMINKLIALNFISMEPQGMPAKRYFKINYENLPECLKSRPPTQKPNEIAVLEKVKPEKPKPKTNKIQDEFDQLWQQYPNKQGKQKAFIAYQKAVKNGATFKEVMQGIQNYNFFIEQTRLEQQFVKHGSTWFNQHGWEDDYTVIEREQRPRTLAERNAQVIKEFLEEVEEREEKGFDEERDYLLFDVDVNELLKKH